MNLPAFYGHRRLFSQSPDSVTASYSLFFPGLSGSSRIVQPSGMNHNRTGFNLQWLVQRELSSGDIVAIDTTPGKILTTGSFYVNEEGHLRPLGLQDTGFHYERIMGRYEEMVKSYGRRARPTVFPVQVTGSKKSLMAEQSSQGQQTTTRKVQKPLTKAERWQERKYLIGRGERSVYPDAQTAARRLSENNVAVEKAKLAENVYKTKNPLLDMPEVPEGWRDISNDEAALRKLHLTPKLLADNDTAPDFLARVYQPDSSVFGKDLSTTVVFRGSRAPEFSEDMITTAKKVVLKGDLSGIKNVKDWTNNGAQGLGFKSDYYKRAVEIGKVLKYSLNVDISGHSLGGGMASAASIASGKPAWTFNAAGLSSGTVEKYGGNIIGSERDIHAYRVQGEMLTKLQEVHFWDDLKSVNYYVPALFPKEEISLFSPDAIGTKYTLPGGVGSMLDRHGIDQAISCIENQKDDDIATIRSRM